MQRLCGRAGSIHLPELIVCLLTATAVHLSQPCRADNLQHIDSAPNGFALYRSGTPSREDLKEWCALGISEVMVLSGDAHRHERRLKDACPTLRIIYDKKQQSEVPVTRQFLEVFDRWVASARESGKKILFRCNCGCHRTGRLAAYYELKYLHRSKEQVLDNLFRFGRKMDDHPELVPQIEALQDYIDHRPCRFLHSKGKRSYCVGKN